MPDFAPQQVEIHQFSWLDTIDGRNIESESQQATFGRIIVKDILNESVLNISQQAVVDYVPKPSDGDLVLEPSIGGCCV